MVHFSQNDSKNYFSAEALGAIGSPESIEILEKYCKDPSPEVAETCEIALDRIKWLSNPDQTSKSCYASVDPAPPSSNKNIPDLKQALLDESLPLFQRYRAMFALRDISSDEALDALGAGLLEGKSALFRHEVAFIMGQLQKPHTVTYLKQSLENSTENEMVRHECAEALGAIATQDCMEVLEKYLNDGKQVVKESCEVALDMSEYENSPEFQYANGLLNISS